MNGEELRTLGDSIAMALASIDRTEHMLLRLLREFDEAEGWHADGQLSMAAWLSWRAGLSPAAAREKVRVARALPELPKVQAAFAAGEITYSKARAITRVATAENEEVLVETAKAMSAAELEKLCRIVRRVGAGDEIAEPERSFSQRTLETGMVRIAVTVTADEAASITTALDSFAPAPNRRAEGLVAMADACNRGEAVDHSPIEVSIHINAEDLDVSAGARRLVCDAGLIPFVCDETGKTLDVGRKTRTIPTATRRALAKRDGGCRFPGCANTIVDGHHIEHWCDGGETKLDNLVSLCRLHHRLVHEGGASVEFDGEKAKFLNQSGEPLKDAPAFPAASPLCGNRVDAWRASPTDSERPINWEWVTYVVLQ